MLWDSNTCNFIHVCVSPVCLALTGGGGGGVTVEYRPDLTLPDPLRCLVMNKICLNQYMQPVNPYCYFTFAQDCSHGDTCHIASSITPRCSISLPEEICTCLVAIVVIMNKTVAMVIY